MPQSIALPPPIALPAAQRRDLRAIEPRLRERDMRLRAPQALGRRYAPGDMQSGHLAEVDAVAHRNHGHAAGRRMWCDDDHVDIVRAAGHRLVLAHALERSDLVAQACRQFEFWFGRPAPVDVYRTAAERLHTHEANDIRRVS